MRLGVNKQVFNLYKHPCLGMSLGGEASQTSESRMRRKDPVASALHSRGESEAMFIPLPGCPALGKSPVASGAPPMGRGKQDFRPTGHPGFKINRTEPSETKGDCFRNQKSQKASKVVKVCQGNPYHRHGQVRTGPGRHPNHYWYSYFKVKSIYSYIYAKCGHTEMSPVESLKRVEALRACPTPCASVRGHWTMSYVVLMGCLLCSPLCHRVRALIGLVTT